MYYAKAGESFGATIQPTDDYCLALEGEGNTDSQRNGPASVCVGTADISDVREKPVHFGKRIRHSTASPEVIVPKQTIVLLQQGRRVHLAWEHQIGGRRRAQAQSSVGYLPGGKTIRHQSPLNNVGYIDAAVAVIGDAEDLLTTIWQKTFSLSMWTGFHFL